MNWLRRLFGHPIALGRRFVVLGMDGLDPRLIRVGIEDETLPNFKKLANQGGFSNLETTWMPLSPVAWSSLISGSHPGTHQIFDFLHRDPSNYEPYLSIAQQEDPPRTVEFGPYSLPLTSGRTHKGREGPAFWTASSRQGVRTSVIRCPVSFPPEPVRGKMLSGLGVPDLNGSQGEFTFLTSDEKVEQSSRGGTVEVVEHPAGGDVTVSLKGPPNPFVKEERRTEIPLDLGLSDGILHLGLPGQSRDLEVGEWTGWLPVQFNFFGPVGVEGQVRFYLQALEPEFELYCSPINVSSEDPAFPISYPEGYASRLTDRVGRFHTLGLTADTGILKEKRVDNATFLEQTSTVLDERTSMLKYELQQFRDGLFTFVFDIPDRIQHMFWRYQDPAHVLYTEREANVYGSVIQGTYRKMDEILGWVLDELDEQDDLLVCSDHGFSSFRRQLCLNTWLVENGYMSLQDGSYPRDVGSLFEGVDWGRTKAYAIGLAGIYVNVKGREQHGIVESDSVVPLLNTLGEELADLYDPEEDSYVIKEPRLAKDVYDGRNLRESPDLLLGYQDGYRVSWESAMGGMSGEVLEDNDNPWSGDHCLHPDLISGSLLTNFPYDETAKVGLWDLMPGIFDRLGLRVPREMAGSDEWT